MRPGIMTILASAALVSTAAAPSGVRHDMLVTTDWLAEHLEAPNLKVVHVGLGREGYDSGHVPGARYLPWEAISVARDGVPNEFPATAELVSSFEILGLGPDDRIVLYDELQGIPAARAYVALDLIGLAGHAALLDGHLAKWKAEERPLATGATVVEPSEIEARPRSEAIAVLAEMERWYGRGALPEAPGLVDARPASHYTGEEPGRDVTRSGHIPGAVHVYWKAHLAESDAAVLRPPEELLKLYSDVGLDSGRRVITYCRSGGQASHTYFTLKYLGFDVSMYDGSFLEWSAGDERPVAVGED